MNEDNFMINVFNDTQLRVKRDYLVETHKCERNTILYRGDIMSPDITSHLTDVTFVTNTTVDTARGFAKLGLKVAALNFADGVVPGGYPEFGAPTQEETFCRVSNLYPILISATCEEYYTHNKKNWNSGICTDYLLYSKGVTTFKDDLTYKVIENVDIDIITCPAPNHTNWETSPLSIYEKRIEQIVWSAIYNHADTIILGAWGCGAFGQDPYLMGLAFANVLNNFSGYFRDVIFAIPSGKNYTQVLLAFENTYKGNIIKG